MNVEVTMAKLVLKHQKSSRWTEENHKNPCGWLVFGMGSEHIDMNLEFGDFEGTNLTIVKLRPNNWYCNYGSK